MCTITTHDELSFQPELIYCQQQKGKRPPYRVKIRYFGSDILCPEACLSVKVYMCWRWYKLAEAFKEEGRLAKGDAVIFVAHAFAAQVKPSRLILGLPAIA